MSAALQLPSILDFAHGLHPDISEAVYHQRHLGLASKSALDIIDKAPAAYLDWVRGRERPDTSAFRLGKAAHAAVLEPERFRRAYVTAPDFGPVRKTDECSSEQAKVNKTRKAEWMAAHAGATILDSETGRHTLGMVNAIAEDPDARALLEAGMAEATALWSDPETGLPCKARIDFYRPDIETVVDFKSTRDARKWAWSRSAETYAYYRQDPMYRDGLIALGHGVRRFVFVVVESVPPYLLKLYELDAADVQQGRIENSANLRTLARCLMTNTWPGYERDGIETITLRHRHA